MTRQRGQSNVRSGPKNGRRYRPAPRPSTGLVYRAAQRIVRPVAEMELDGRTLWTLDDQGDVGTHKPAAPAAEEFTVIRERATMDRHRRGLPNIAGLKKLLQFKRAIGLQPHLTGAEARDQSRTFKELKLARVSLAAREKIRQRDNRRDRVNALGRYA